MVREWNLRDEDKWEGGVMLRLAKQSSTYHTVVGIPGNGYLHDSCLGERAVLALLDSEQREYGSPCSLTSIASIPLGMDFLYLYRKRCFLVDRSSVLNSCYDSSNLLSTKYNTLY